MPELNRNVALWTDKDTVRQHMINARPAHARGKLAYGPFEFGWILSEVTERLTGKTLAQFCHDEIAAPLGLPDLRYGLGVRG